MIDNMTVNEPHLCPHRMMEPKVGNSTELDSWNVRKGKRSCSYCGSLHPDDVLFRMSVGERVIPTDKNYKMYIGEHDKVYFQHFDKNQMKELVQLNNDGTIKFGEPGYFYVLPFFMSYTETKS